MCHWTTSSWTSSHHRDDRVWGWLIHMISYRSRCHVSLNRFLENQSHISNLPLVIRQNRMSGWLIHIKISSFWRPHARVAYPCTKLTPLNSSQTNWFESFPWHHNKHRWLHKFLAISNIFVYQGMLVSLRGTRASKLAAGVVFKLESNGLGAARYFICTRLVL